MSRPVAPGPPVQQIRAIHCSSLGTPARLDVVHLPRPRLVERSVRVRVEHCGIGFPDALILAGKYQVRHELPFVPGSEIAGVVTDVADGVEYPRVGARVVGLDQSLVGGLAEEAVCDASCVVELPDDIPTRVAAGMTVNYSTAYYGLVQRAAVRPGEKALVLGAGGNIGTAFLDVLGALGAIPYAACSSEKKLAVARRHGAVDGFDYTRQPIKQAVARLTHGSGLDLVVDPVGGAYTEAALRCLRPGGRLLVVGFATGEIPRIPMNLPLLKGCAVVGVLLNTLMTRQPAEFKRNLEALFGLYRAGHVHTELIEVDCFTDFACGIALLSKRERVGKIVMGIAEAGDATRNR